MSSLLSAGFLTSRFVLRFSRVPVGFIRLPPPPASLSFFFSSPCLPACLSYAYVAIVLLLPSLRPARGRLNILYVTKQASVPKCGDCGDKLRGMKALRPNKLKNSITSKRQKHVTRAYGGARYSLASCLPAL